MAGPTPREGTYHGCVQHESGAWCCSPALRHPAATDWAYARRHGERSYFERPWTVTKSCALLLSGWCLAWRLGAAASVTDEWPSQAGAPLGD